MADFTEEINKCADKVKISDDVGCILWADDILLLSESEGGGGGGLRQMLLGLEKLTLLGIGFFCSY